LSCGAPISRRAAKSDIRSVVAPDLERIYEELRQIKLSTYQYKDQPASSPRRLGFIIDDTDAPAAINPDGNTVDLYGYLSMAVAAVQVQAKQIEDLKARIRTLEATSRGPRERRSQSRGHLQGRASNEHSGASATARKSHERDPQ
jgi:hypothetical protein